MNLLSRFRALILLPLLLLLCVVLLWWAIPETTLSTRVLTALLAALGLLQLGLLYQIKHRLLRPLASLERGAEIILKTHAAHDLELPAEHLLGGLPESLHGLGDALSQARTEVSSALRSGAERVQSHKIYLERVIQGLEEGVLVCDAGARIILYNPAAYRILQQHPALGLGRLVYDLLPRIQLEHTFERLRQQQDAAGDFICTLNDSEQLLRCRTSLLFAHPDADHSAREEQGAVIAFDDVSLQQQRLQQRYRLFSATLEGLRGPLANLRAATETLTDYPDMSSAERTEFDRVIAAESRHLSDQLTQLADSEGALVGQEWQLANIYAADLIHLLHRQLGADQLTLTLTGVPLWLTTDSQALVALFDHLIHCLAELRQLRQFDIETLSGEHGIYLDLSWRGAPLTQAELESCQQTPLTSVVGHPRADELARQLGGELWSQPHPRIDGMAILRLPLPGADMGEPERPGGILPARPMVYDFDLFQPGPQHDSLMDTPLRQLNYVVFDTETTGLHPEQGDEVVSIAAVRIVNQRILPDENFNQLVNPGRPIPRDSIRYHGINDAQVVDAPSLIEVLPRFKAFAEGTVLVAHNAWFDMAFIRRREAQSRAYFTNPILDTLMLSVCLHGHEVEQSLDAITQRLGIDILGRHSALGDSLATAKLLLAQIDLLEARSIITLRDALNAYR
ncbi:MAG: exonuclease domain-containing protein [Motiliproteus sp.]